MFIWSGLVWLMATCLYLVVWALPLGKAQSIRWYLEAQKIVLEHEFRKNEAYREIISLRAAHAEKVGELQTSLNEALTDLRNVRMELRRTQEI